MEHKGSDADGGWGLFQGANTHHSEREFIDGVAALGDGAGAQLLRYGLTKSLVDEAGGSQGERQARAYGLAEAVFKRDAGLVPDDGFWSGVRGAGQTALDKAGEALGWVDQLRETVLDAALDETFGLSDKMASLKPGDSWRVGAKGDAGLGVVGKAQAEMEVKRNEDGTYTLKTASAFAVGPSAKLLEGVGGVTGEIEYTFDNLEDAKNATQALFKTAAGASPHEMDTLLSNISAIEVTGTAAAEVDARFGVSNWKGGGAEGKIQLGEGRRIEIRDGEPVALVHTYSSKLEGTLENSHLLEHEDISIPQGTASGEAGVRIDVRRPITSPVPGDNLADKLVNVLKDPDKVQTGQATLDLTYSAQGKIDPLQDGSATRGYELGLKIENLDPSKAGDVFEHVRHGRFRDAADASGVKVDPTFDKFVEEGFEGEADIFIASLGGKNYVRHLEG